MSAHARGHTFCVLDLVTLDHSAFLRNAFAAIASVVVGAAPTGSGGLSGADAASAAIQGTPTASRRRVLLAYFSRAGENYYHGGRRDLKVGNTEVVARMISKLIRCDVHRIRAADPYRRQGSIA